jgi:lysophospholipase L1-like esterase
VRALVFVSLAASIIWILGSAATSGSAPLDGAPPGTYVALGDSLAAGVGATSPAESGYVGLVYAAISQNGDGANGNGVSSLTNLAIPGETTASFITGGQLEAALDAIADPAVDVRLVTLSLGGNDLLRLLLGGPCLLQPTGTTCQQQVGASLQGLAQNYPDVVQQLMEALNARGTGGTLAVHTYYNPFSGTGTSYEAAVDAVLLGTDGVIDCEAAEPAAIGMNDIIACAAASHGARVIDIQPQFAGRGRALTLIGQQDVHPNDAGHSVIADAIAGQLLGAN